jgi:cellulose synthase/poly-beta-1,6-N-acetylglucosamine synthase-like glycosyltransferase
MLYWEFIFWISTFIFFYNYIGYPVLIYFFNTFQKKAFNADPDYRPSVSFIVAAYNEESCIEQKIVNCLSLKYPKDLIEFIFITDGSTDKTVAIISAYPFIKLMHQSERGGKTHALNRAVASASNEILVFNDANTIINEEAILRITRHYKDQTVGGVAGEKKVINPQKQEFQSAGNEGFYWKYESFLKQLDSDFYSVVGAAGELFSIRRSLYEPIDKRIILDDFIISMEVAIKGYKVVYEKEAYASELPSQNLQEEQKRKIRIAAGGFQAMTILKPANWYWRYPRLLFLYISHRVLRWAFSPFCLILAFVSSLIMSILSGLFYWKLFFAIQFIVYVTVLTTHIISPEKVTFKPAKLLYYFVFMNVSVISGFFRFLRGSQSAVWEKAKRTA